HARLFGLYPRLVVIDRRPLPAIGTEGRENARLAIRTEGCEEPGIRRKPRKRQQQNKQRCFHRLKTIICCCGSTSIDSSNFRPCGSISARTCRSVILCSGRIGTFGSSPRYSSSTRRPPGLSDSFMRS